MEDDLQKMTGSDDDACAGSSFGCLDFRTNVHETEVLSVEWMYSDELSVILQEEADNTDS